MNAGYIDRKLQGGLSGLTVPNRCAAKPSSLPGRLAGRNHERSTNMKKKLFIGMLAAVCMVIFSLPAAAKKDRPVGFGFLYYDGEIVRTVVPPASMPFQGRDNIYPIAGGVDDQLPIAAVAPGDRDYHGGKWAVNLVEWNTDPYLLTSEDEVMDAAQAGVVTITRVPGNDFKCPIQP